MQPQRHGRWFGSLFCLTLAFATAPASSQSQGQSGVRGTWRPWTTFTAGDGPRRERAVTAAQAQAFEKQLLALRNILMRAFGGSALVGFNVETKGDLYRHHMLEHAPGQLPGSVLPVAGALRFAALPFAAYAGSGQLVPDAFEGIPTLEFAVNHLGPTVFRNGLSASTSRAEDRIDEWEGVDTDAFQMPALERTIGGFPVYGYGLVITKSRAPLWTALTLEAALELVRASRQAQLRAGLKDLEEFKAYSGSVRDPATIAKRMEAAKAEAAKAPDPAKFLAEVARHYQNELRYLDTLLASGEVENSRIEAQSAIDEVATWLTALTPSQRRAPACYDAYGRSPRDKFRIAPADDCVPLVRPNDNFFNQALPRTAPQVVVVFAIESCTARTLLPGGCAANRALVETLDVDAIRAWLQ